MTSESDETRERLESMSADVMAAYAVAEESLTLCQSTGDPADVDRHRADLRHAFKVSNAYHLEADMAVLSWRASQEDT